MANTGTVAQSIGSSGIRNQNSSAASLQSAALTTSDSASLESAVLTSSDSSSEADDSGLTSAEIGTNESVGTVDPNAVIPAVMVCMCHECMCACG